MAVENTAPSDNAPQADTKPEVADDLLGDGAPATVEGGKDTVPGEDDEDNLLEGKVKKEEEAPAATDSEAAYEFKIPDGYEADAELAEISKPVFAKHKLSQEQAQGLVEELGPQIMTKLGEKWAAQWSAQKAEWSKAAKADPEIFDAAKGAVRPDIEKARTFLGADFTAAIKQLGGHNHPAVLKALAKIGSGLGEDTPGFGKPAKAPITAEQRLYPNDQPKE